MATNSQIANAYNNATRDDLDNTRRQNLTVGRNYNAKLTNRQVQIARDQPLREALEGVHRGPSSEYVDRQLDLATNETLNRTESDINRMVDPNDSKVSGYMRQNAFSTINQLGYNRHLMSLLGSDYGQLGAVQSAFSRMGELRGLSSGLSSINDNKNMELARALQGGGLFGEIAAGAGSAFGTWKASQLYSKMYSGADKEKEETK